MYTRRVKKNLLQSLILLFLILILGQPTWAGKWADIPSDLNLVIQSVYVDLNNNLILITGENFDNGAFPDVTLGGIGLEVESYSRHELIAELPVDIPDGDYKLVISTGNAVKQYDAYGLTIGTVGPQGPSGPPGPPGITAWKIVDNDGVANWGTSRIEGAPNCDIVNGYTVTGGGFSIPQGAGVTVIESRPVEDGTGWMLVLALPVDKIPEIDVTVWAVCVQVQ